MVLEKILSTYLLEKKTPLAFLLGLIYTIIGIISAKILFPDYLGIVSVAFASILILPSINNLLEDTVNIAALERKPGIISFLKDNRYLMKIYFFLFCGIFVAFAAFAMLSSSQISGFFEQQAGILAVSKGSRYSQVDFSSILSNNLVFLLFCLFASILYGGGAVFILSWNAFLWGTVFGSIAREYSAISILNPVTVLVISMVTVIPHMVMEVLAYIFAAISGGLFSVAIGSETFFSQRFNNIISNASIIFVIAIIFIVAGAFLESNILPWIESKKSYLDFKDQLFLMAAAVLLSIAFLLRFYYFRQKND